MIVLLTENPKVEPPMADRTGMRSKRGTDRGAALVETALVAPLLLTLILGVVDFSLVMFDGAGLREGTRTATRQAAVNNYGSDTSCPITGWAWALCRCGTRLLKSCAVMASITATAAFLVSIWRHCAPMPALGPSRSGGPFLCGSGR